MLTIYRPIKTSKITQHFGSADACVKTGTRSVIASKRNSVCPAGYEDFYARLSLKGHNGTDMACWHGEPVYFSVVAETEWYALDSTDASGGIGVTVVSKDAVDLGSLGKYHVKFRFWHMKQEVVEDDQMVTPGQLLGYGDSTGASSGDHVHMDMKLCDETGATLNQENGYRGAMDIMPWYHDQYILDALGIPTMVSDTLKSMLRRFV